MVKRLEYGTYDYRQERTRGKSSEFRSATSEGVKIFGPQESGARANPASRIVATLPPFEAKHNQLYRCRCASQDKTANIYVIEIVM